MEGVYLRGERERELADRDAASGLAANPGVLLGVVERAEDEQVRLVVDAAPGAVPGGGLDVVDVQILGRLAADAAMVGSSESFPARGRPVVVGPLEAVTGVGRRLHRSVAASRLKGIPPVKLALIPQRSFK